MHSNRSKGAAARCVAGAWAVITALSVLTSSVSAQNSDYMSIQTAVQGTYTPLTNQSRLIGVYAPGSYSERKKLEYMWGTDSPVPGWTPHAVANYVTRIDSNANNNNNVDLTSAPSTVDEAEDVAIVALSRAIRFTRTWDPNDRDPVVTALKVAALPNASSASSKVKNAKVATMYVIAYDLIKPWISSLHRSQIETNLMSPTFRGKIGYPTNNHNQKQVVAAARGLLALTIQDFPHLITAMQDLNQALDKLNTSFQKSVAASGFHTDGVHYVNFVLPQLLPFATALRHSDANILIVPQMEKFVEMYLRTRLPSGLTPNLHNGEHTCIPLWAFTRMIDDQKLKEASIWHLEQIDEGYDWGDLSSFFYYNTTSPHVLFLLTDNTVQAASEPDYSPTWFSDRTADVAVMKDDWSTDSEYIMLQGGKDGDHSSNWDQFDSGEIYVCANGAPIIVGSGYGQIGEHNQSFPNDDPQPWTQSFKLRNRNAEYESVLLARDTITGSNWGVGGKGNNNYPDTNDYSWLTNRHDADELGDIDPQMKYKGAVDFCTLKLAYRGTGAPGRNANNERSIAHCSEDYFVVADTFTSVGIGNKDFAFNMMGKGTFTNASTSDPANYRKARWKVFPGTYYGPHRTLAGTSTSSPNHDNSAGGKIWMHLLSTHDMVDGSTVGLGDEVVWHTDMDKRRVSTTRHAVAVKNVNSGGFLAILEPDDGYGTISHYDVTDECTPHFAGAMVDFNEGPMTDWWCDSILSQDSQVLRTLTRLQSDAKFAYVRQESLVFNFFGTQIVIPCVVPSGLFMAAGTELNVSILGGPHQSWMSFTSLKTVSWSLDWSTGDYAEEVSAEAMFRKAGELDEENPVFEDDPWQDAEHRIWVGRVEDPIEFMTFDGEDIAWQYDEEREEIVVNISQPGTLRIKFTQEVIDYWINEWVVKHFDPEVHEWEEYQGEG